MRQRRTITGTAAGFAAAATLSACGTPSSAVDTEGDLVLADGYAPGGYNPIAGYGLAGESIMYDGLVQLTGGDGMPGFEPALASALPVPNEDATAWTASLRDGVAFSDGSALDAEDVVATYRAILDPASASEVRSSFEMIDTVAAVDDSTVRFTLRYPYAPFATKMLIGIVPSESVAAAQPATESTLNTAPVGTGPYVLRELRPDRAVFEANDNYWAGAPELKTVTYIHVPDDNTRAQRTAAGEVDGANLPPLLARRIAGQDTTLTAHTSADWRGVSLPTGDPVTGDKAIRVALNLAANRPTMIDHVLGGHGRPASTPIPDVYGAAYDPDATFPYDPQRAEELLDDAGWERGADGIREKDGNRAEFTLMYNSEDTLRRDLAQAFASDALAVGVEIDLEALSWDRIDPRINTDATLLGGGSEPYDPDTQAYTTLSSQYVEPGVGSIYDNASDYSNPAVDEALDRARRELDPDTRNSLYRDMQVAYVADPGYVFLAFLDHTYISRDSEWATSEPILEPHSHGVTWGPWWSLDTWTREP